MVGAILLPFAQSESRRRQGRHSSPRPLLIIIIIIALLTANCRLVDLLIRRLLLNYIDRPWASSCHTTNIASSCILPRPFRSILSQSIRDGMVQYTCFPRRYLLLNRWHSTARTQWRISSNIINREGHAFRNTWFCLFHGQKSMWSAGGSNIGLAEV